MSKHLFSFDIVRIDRHFILYICVQFTLAYPFFSSIVWPMSQRNKKFILYNTSMLFIYETRMIGSVNHCSFFFSIDVSICLVFILNCSSSYIIFIVWYTRKSLIAHAYLFDRLKLLAFMSSVHQTNGDKNEDR